MTAAAMIGPGGIRCLETRDYREPVVPTCKIGGTGYLMPSVSEP